MFQMAKEPKKKKNLEIAFIRIHVAYMWSSNGNTPTFACRKII